MEDRLSKVYFLLLTLTSNTEEEEPDFDFEAVMAAGDDQATSNALEGMNKAKKKKGKKGKKVHKRK